MNRRALIRLAILTWPLALRAEELSVPPAGASAKAPPVMLNVKAFGAVGDGSHDDTAAFVKAVGSVPAAGGTIYVPAGRYLITSAINVRGDRTNIRGDGRYVSTLIFAPEVDSSCLVYGKTNGETINQFSISELAIYSGGNPVRKTAIEIRDASTYSIDQVSIAGPTVVGRTRSWTGPRGCVGIHIRGREAGVIRRADIAADRPVVISKNPQNGIGIDHHHFQDLYLIANRYPCVEIESGVNLSNVTFDGYQAWVSGTHGLYWNDTETKAVSLMLRICNVRTEQGTDASAYQIFIRHNHGLQDLSIDGLYGGVERNGIFLRGVQNASVLNWHYTSSSGISLDASPPGLNSRIRLINARAERGSRAKLSGYSIEGQTAKSSSADALPYDAVLVSGGVAPETRTQ